MSVKLEKVSGCKVKLSFTVAKEDFDLALDQAFEKKVKDLEAPGFRKGKMPRHMYESKYGVESLYEEAITFAANKAYIEYLQKSKLEVVSYPELDVDFKTVAKGKKLNFTIEVEVWPDVKLGQYKELEVAKESTEVKKKDIEEYIERILKQHAELEIVEDAPLAKGHTAVFDFEGSVDGVLFDGGKAENYSLEIGSGQFIPGFEEQMEGMKVNEEKTIQVKFPEGYQAENLAGKDADFKIKLHEIKKRVTPALTDEFVKEELEIENVKTADEYRKFVSDVIAKEKKEASENKFTDDLLTKAIDNAQVEIPEAMIQEDIDRQVKQVENQAKMYGLTAEQLLQYTGVESMEKYKETIKPSAEMGVKQRIVLSEIAKAEKFKVSAADYKKELKVIAEEMKATVADAEKRYTKESLTPYLLMQKAIQLIKDTAIVK